MKHSLIIVVNLLLLVLAACAPQTAYQSDPAALLAGAQTAVARATGTTDAATAQAYQAMAQQTAVAADFAHQTAVASTSAAVAAAATRDAVNGDLAEIATRLHLGEIAGNQTREAHSTAVALELIAQAEAVLIADHQAELANRRQQEAIALKRQNVMIYVTPVLWLTFIIVLGVVGWQLAGWLKDRNRVAVHRVNGRDVPFIIGDVRIMPGRVAHDEPLALPPPTAVGGAPIMLPQLLEGHVMVAGPTRSGKSTALRAIARQRSANSVIVLDPHARPGAWPGAQVVGGGRNFEAIASFMAWMMDELNDRASMMSESGSVLPPVTVITDEMPAITAELGNGTLRVWQAWVREGWKFGLFFVVGTQSLLVKSLGIEGQGDLRDNFLNVIALGSLARKEFPELTAGQERPAVLIPQNEEPYPIVIPYVPQDDAGQNANAPSGRPSFAPPPTTNLPRPVTQAEHDARLLEPMLSTLTSKTNAGRRLAEAKGTLSEGVDPSSDMIRDAETALQWRISHLNCEQSRQVLAGRNGRRGSS